MRHPLSGPISLALALVAASCSPSAPPELGEPVAGISADQARRFAEGQALFNRVFAPEEGIGPLFNENQCSACHTDPVSGGTGEQLILKASRFLPPDGCDPLRQEGGENVRTRATPLLRAHGIEREPFPASATERGRFTVPFLFGLGLVEAIPAGEILRREDPQDADGDGVSGRAARLPDGTLGRFGRKGDFATLRGFTDTALRFEMGLTTPENPEERAMVGFVFTPAVDPVPDPEVDRRTVDRLVEYVRLLAPPAARTPREPEERTAARRGEARFAELGCSACHTPEMRTGRSEVAALSRKPVRLYSDLLLHDMGPELASVCGPAATPSEYRTEPLMGVGHRRSFLHDGRATNLIQAILLHGGEAAGARARFQALNRLEQEDLVAFLRTL